MRSLTREDFSPGIYLCSGSHSNMWWWVDRLGFSPETIHATAEDLSALTFSASPFDDAPEFLVVFPKGKIRISTDSIPQNQIVLIMLSEYDGTLASTKAAAYKKYASGKVKQIDWNQIKNWKTVLIEERPELTKLLSEVNSPMLLNYVLSSVDNKEDLTESYTPGERVVTELFNMLGTKASIKRYSELTRGELYSIFLLPDRDKCSFHTLLVKGYGRGTFGICPNLWLYFDMYLNQNLSKFRFEPELLMRQFATWVYLTNTYCATREYRGLHSYKNRMGRTVHMFNPSKKSLCLFHSTHLA